MKEFKALVRAEIRKTKEAEKLIELKKFSTIIEDVYNGARLVIPNKKELARIKKELKTKWKAPQKVIDNLVLTE
jgi:hypothetical protein